MMKINSNTKTIDIGKEQALYLDFLGKVLTREVVDDIKETGSDACGENGEYHTFVYDGPIFKYPIKFQRLNVIKNETYGFLDVKDSENE